MPQNTTKNIRPGVTLLEKLHHIGCAVYSLDQSLAQFLDTAGTPRVSSHIMIPSQKVRVCFVETAPDVFLELVEPLEHNSPVHTFLQKKIVYYHLCYEVRNADEVATLLEQKGYVFVNRFSSPAFSNTECIFLLSPDGGLVELCERGSFSAFTH